MRITIRAAKDMIRYKYLQYQIPFTINIIGLSLENSRSQIVGLQWCMAILHYKTSSEIRNLLHLKRNAGESHPLLIKV